MSGELNTNPYGVTVDGKPPSPEMLDLLSDMFACAEEGGREAEALREAGVRTWGNEAMIRGGQALKATRQRHTRRRLGVTVARRSRGRGSQRRPRARRTRQTHSPPGDGEPGEPEPERPAHTDDDVDGAA